MITKLPSNTPDQTIKIKEKEALKKIVKRIGELKFK